MRGKQFLIWCTSATRTESLALRSHPRMDVSHRGPQSRKRKHLVHISIQKVVYFEVNTIRQTIHTNIGKHPRYEYPTHSSTAVLCSESSTHNHHQPGSECTAYTAVGTVPRACKGTKCRSTAAFCTFLQQFSF